MTEAALSAVDGFSPVPATTLADAFADASAQPSPAVYHMTLAASPKPEALPVYPADPSLPTVADLCADPHAAAQMSGGCTAPDDQTFQHVGVGLLFGGEVALVLFGLVLALVATATAWKALKAVWRSLAAA